MITVLTTTYNRKHTLPRLYESLLRQTNSDFEWLIIDDGSTDGTEALVHDWISDAKIPIVYKYKSNGGMHTAMNAGIEIARRELICKCDSDDYLTEEAIEIIKRDWETVKDDSAICGMTYLNAYLNTGEIIGNSYHHARLVRSYIQQRYHDGLKGDKTVAIRTDVWRAFPYVVFEGETSASVATATAFNRMSKEYSFLCVNKIVKFMDYQETGLTKSSRHTPKANRLYHKECTTKEFPFTTRWRSMEKYIRLSMAQKSFISAYKEVESKSFFLLVCVFGLPYKLFVQAPMDVIHSLQKRHVRKKQVKRPT